MRQTKVSLVKHSANIRNLAIYASILFLAIGFIPQSALSQSASELQRRIDTKDQEIQQAEEEINSLRNQADTYENRLSILKTEARQLQTEIDNNKQKIKQTNKEIDEKKRELKRTKELIQENVRTLYKEGEASTIEVLFSSDSFSDFLSRKEYLDAAKDSLNDAAEKSTRLKSELENKKEDLSVRSKRLNGQKEQLASKQTQQRRLIKQTRGEENRYQDLVQRQKQEKSQLEEQQRQAYERELANARAQNQFVGGDHSGSSSYPWADASTSAVDDWELFARQCVSYTAWKVASTGRYVPKFGGRGNANQWPDTTEDYGIPHGDTPKAGSVAVSYNGPYGHTMYVEEVLDGGNSIRISEYNLVPYQYSERIIPASGLTYIYF